jgi:hypothetical protein
MFRSSNHQGIFVRGVFIGEEFASLDATHADRLEGHR